MVKVQAFQGHRGHPSLVEYITNYPCEIDLELMKCLIKDNPYSFSRIQCPAVDL